MESDSKVSQYKQIRRGGGDGILGHERKISWNEDPLTN